MKKRIVLVFSRSASGIDKTKEAVLKVMGQDGNISKSKQFKFNKENI